VRRIGLVIIKRGASIGASMPMCGSLSKWLGSNGASLVCLQLQGLSWYEEGNEIDIIISGLYHAASAAAADGAPLQLQQLSLDGDSLLAAMRLLPLLPGLQQMELSALNLSVGPGMGDFAADPTPDPRLQQLREHPGITRLALTFTVDPNFKETWVYGSKVASLLLHSACPQQLQDLTLRWQPAVSSFARSAECSIHVKQLAHLKQLRKLTLDKVALFPPHPYGEDAEVEEEVVGRLEQVKLLFQNQQGIHQQLSAEGLPALLPKLVELHATRQTFVFVAAACSHLTSIRLGSASYDNLMPDVADTDKLVADLAGMQQLRKLVLPPITVADPYSMDMSHKVTRLVQLEELCITSEPGLLELQRLTASQRLTSLSLSLMRPSPTLSSSTGGVLWQDVGLTQLTGLQHLAVQGAFLAAASPAALEALTALTALTVSLEWRTWQQLLPEVASVLASSPAAQQRLRVVYAVSVVSGGVRKVYRALRRALPRTRVEVVTGPVVPGWLREAA
jgi:hypothetical protein